MTNWTINNQDVLEWAAAYDGEPFMAMLCDPPYELGFMGKHWDKSGLVFDPATWAALAKHLHPGAFGMAFASSRGWHRLACAIEDAGLVIHPSIFLWGFGSGFPKATRVKDAEAFAGHRYGLQCLKPAAEPLIVFQKPYAGKPVDSITRTGAGALNVDAARIKTGDDLSRPLTEPKGWKNSSALNGSVNDDWKMGRWPANFALLHSPACNGVCAPSCAVRRLGEQSGDLHGPGNYKRGTDVTSRDIYQKGMGYQRAGTEKKEFERTGTAARFFFNAQYEQIDAADPVRYQAKASRRERDAGLDGMPLKQKRILNGGITSADHPNTSSGGGDRQARNIHPTCKPVALIEHLATLLLPPAEYAPRRILIPFAGSGSEMIGAGRAGWDGVIGIEREAEYVEIAEKRLAHWLGQKQIEMSMVQTDEQISLFA